jgi:CBS domain-containing protein
LIGIFSERDYARKVELKNKYSRDTSVAEIMTRKLVRADASESIESCMNKMSEHHIRHLPVMEAGELMGIISIGDLVNFVISEQQFKIDQLENYIQGS